VLEEDPLRMLRAYRLALQLGFSLDPSTRISISQKGDLIKRTAPERVIQELLKLFSLGTTASILNLMREDRFDLPLLGFRIGERALEGVSVFEKLKRNGFLTTLKGRTDFGERTFLGRFDGDTLLKLTTFLYPHRGWEAFLKLYPLGQEGKKFVESSVRGFEELVESPPKGVEEKHLYLKRYAPYLYPIGVLAKIYGHYGDFEELLEFYRRWKNLKKPLLGGREVMELLGVKRGSPAVGRALERLIMAQLEGSVRSRKEAIGFIEKLKGELL